MGQGYGYGLNYADGQSGGAFMQGDGTGMWMGDPVDNQIQLIEAGLWNPGGNINNMNQWGYNGGYQQ